VTDYTQCPGQKQTNSGKITGVAPRTVSMFSFAQPPKPDSTILKDKAMSEI
jgi:hypothetical protein